MVIMSHLSDAQEYLGVGMSQESANRHIKFVKYLLLKQMDLDYEMSPDGWNTVYLQFMKKHS